MLSTGREGNIIGNATASGWSPLTHSLFDFGGQFLGWVSPDFGEGRMIMWHGRQLVDCHAAVHGRDDFMDEFAPERPPTTAADDLAGHWVSQQLRKAVP